MTPENQLFKNFMKTEDLTPAIGEKFQIYLKELQVWNERINLTTITDEQGIINYHFKDSLALVKYVDLSQIHMLADVGSGAGVPGIPLKIKFPKLSIVLIEVNTKKIRFLEHIIKILALESIEIYSLDWRTFLRKTHYPIDIICARASLQLDELLRMFKPTCHYQQAQLVYWASRNWKPESLEQSFKVTIHEYHVGTKKRKLVFFKKKEDHHE